jgi:hypothetical protein
MLEHLCVDLEQESKEALATWVLVGIRKLYFDSAHNKTVQHNKGAFYRIYINNKTTQVTCIDD